MDDHHGPAHINPSHPSATCDGYVVQAVAWELGWALNIEGAGTAQTTSMAAAERMVREHLHARRRQDAWTASVTFVP